MIKENQKNKFPELVEAIKDGMENLKASNITILDLTELENSVCDYFIICDANSNTQVRAISNSVEDNVRKTLNEKPWHVEGLDNSQWILMDYVHVAAHVFQAETRDFYDLEGLWGDAKVTVLENNF
ncbi:ribosome silencing factor [Owenweeksia hongkongensis]|uniref:Ribosomal silencing factor RsfS n=1 Tax=Owenweeksia hongkongensis (strain DSM 17368 / CIP 108786 / JCM 12287 / NRRL B-23963 / UST20020801) TaxID=926562 RepID=G8QZC8_OWEHD|nr:ribosome silencing factor [Owenweeksia hongkongensis]AEV32556.1 iojap-like ribosome-associated protein [Owenweeksia hongkongensis DSM 17368]